ncbi:MAG: SpoIIE family protein phosphatase [bacterium]|nr:SpoIIE family protein phosphatase [bacterium]
MTTSLPNPPALIHEPAPSYTLRERWLRFLQPATSVTHVDDRRTATLLVYMAFTLAAVLSVAAVVSVFTSIFFPDPTISLGLAGTTVIGLAALGFWVAVYYSKTHRFMWGAWVMIGTIYAFVLGFMAFYPVIGGPLTVAFIIPGVIASLFLNARGTARVLAVAVVLTLISLPLQGITIVSFAVTFNVILVVTLLTTLIAVQRERDLRQIRRLRELEAAEGERLRHELELARKVQMSMLPKELPAIPEHEIAAYSQPAFEASGDFYDVFFLGHNNGDGRKKLGIVVCDVAGKGISSALIMSATRAAIRAEAERTESPALVLHKVNEMLADSVPAGLFVTLFYGVYTPDTRTLCYASAGHPHPFHWSGSAIAELENFGMPLGLVPDSDYADVVVTLADGDSVFIYTDGLVEALNPRRELYGFEAVQHNVAQHVGARISADQVVRHTVRDMEIFVEGERQQDDVTIVVLQVKTKPADP